MSSSSPGTGPNGTLETARAPLPSFTPVRHQSDVDEGKPESSASGSLRSRSAGRSKEEAPVRKSVSSSSNLRPSIEQQDDAQPTRRTSNRNSGGFLLESLGRSSRLSRSFLQRTQRGDKGKRKSEESELSIPKRRLRDTRHQTTSSIGSSPLSHEVTPDARANGNGNIVLGTDVRHNMGKPTASPSTSRNGTGQSLDLNRAPPNVGFDSDPAQIVNMALSLSAARQRQASAKRYVTGDQTRSRAVSGATNNSPRSRVATGSIAQYLAPDRSPSVNSNNRPQTPQLGVQRQDHGQEISPRTNLEDQTMIDADADEDEDGEAEISQPTAHRVQAARVYFELAYEHRRLLSHLPPIGRPDGRARASSPDSHSKMYNPLQYIRNRKLRIWDKTTMNGEEEGWHDIEKVRTWVNTVIGNHHETRHDPDECVRLPLLQPNSHSESDPDAKKAKDAGHQQVKRRRPRSDWVTHPGDMIADCFWLEQGVNKIKILDRDNNHIYPQNTQFKFSGWRNRTPIHAIPEGLLPTPPPEEADDYEREPLEDAPALPTFKSAHHQRDSHRGSKLKKRDKIKDSFVVTKDSKDRQKSLRLFMDDSDSGSDSSRSPGASEDEADRGRKRLSKKWQKHMHSAESSPPGSLRSPPTNDSMFANTLSPSDRSAPSSAQNSKRPSTDNGILAKLKSHTPNRSLNRNDDTPHDSIFKFPSFADQPRSSGEYETTAPNSPVTTRAPMWPSIAINLESPPHSRSPSPTKRLKHLNPFRDRSQSNRHDGISRADFAVASDLPHAHEKHGQDKSSSGSRGTSPMTRGHSPLSKSRTESTATDAGMTPIDHRASTVSRVSSKSAAPSAKEDHGRVRGIFKGGRIAELVGNEVSRVGGFIWKRDPPGLHRRHESHSTSSLKSRDDPDSDEEGFVNGTVVKTPPRPSMMRSRSSTLSTKSEKSPTLTKSTPSSGEKPKYNNPNLPSFISPFERDKERREQKQNLLSPTTSPDNQDHISRQAAEHRSSSRSPRLDKLAPPKLNISRQGSPTRPDGLSHVASYGFGPDLDLTSSRAASDKYNNAINKSSENLKGLRATQSALDLSRMSSRDLLANEELQPVTNADIERARVLLLSSAIKAREIGRRADLPRNHTPQFLLDTLNHNDKRHHQVDLSLVSRREEHVVAARNVMVALSDHGNAFDEKMKQFSGEVAPGLHRSLQELEDLVDNKMTPRVRNTSDEAGELSMKLTTTSTLAIKGLNDTIDGALRRRRRGPVRWVRRLWFAGIEYTVVGLLWGIWAVVMMIQIVLGTVHGVVHTTRWMLWLD